MHCPYYSLDCLGHPLIHRSWGRYGDISLLRRTNSGKEAHILVCKKCGLIADHPRKMAGGLKYGNAKAEGYESHVESGSLVDYATRQGWLLVTCSQRGQFVGGLYQSASGMNRNQLLAGAHEIMREELGSSPTCSLF
ncbi:hypothetical protein VNO77_27088 [Canavalia gladiata]|uniref:Uncharacterized protein n=1 Tax=Canavalia gladiata TaxID=3824 RepID=A0AAN9KU53_CANGL